MARDRLAAMRQQQGYDRPSYPQQSGGGGYNQQPYDPPPQQGGYGAGGGGYGGQQGGGGGGYEMQGMGGAQGGNDMNAFFEEIGSIQDAIKQLNANISQIGDLHSRQLTSLDSSSAGQASPYASQLQQLQSQTSRLTSSLKTRISTLTQPTSRLPPSGDTNVRRTQEGAVKKRFMEAIQEYQRVEKESRDRYRGRMERQVRIVKPDATDEEVREAVEGGEGGQVFSQALLNSNRYGDARAAYREVQDRHEDIRKIEQTITELAQLFSDMAILTEEQDEKVVAIDQGAQGAEQDLGHAEQQMQVAVKSARAARRKRWICLGIGILIVAVIAIVVAVVVVQNQNKSSGNKSS